MITSDIDKDGVDEVIGDFDLLGLWCWDGGTWTELSEANAQNIMAADVNGDGEAAVVGDLGRPDSGFGRGTPGRRSRGLTPNRLLAGDYDGDGQSELIADFGPLGLWLWNGGAWSRVNSLDADELKDLKGKGTGPANF